MAEPPDFEQLAWRLKYFIDDQPQLSVQNHRAIADALKQVWNARGAADTAAVNAEAELTAKTPDLEQIAQRLIGKLSDEMDPENAKAFVREFQTAVWNARGAVDLDAMETAHANYDWSELEDAIRSLDR